MKRKFMFFFLMGIIFLQACGKDEANREISLLAEEESLINYEVFSAERGIVTVTVSVPFEYNVTEIHEYAFDVDNEIVAHVYVEKGDEVSNGDVLVVLDTENTEEELKELEYRVSKKELEISHTKEERDFEIERLKYMYEYTDKTQEDKKELNESIEKTGKQYERTLTSLTEDLSLLKLKLEVKENLIDQSRICADMDGVVSYVKGVLEGNSVTKGDVVVRVYNRDSSLFICKKTEYMELFPSDDQVYVMSSGIANSRVEFEVKPANREEWGEEFYFVPINSDIDIDIGDSSKIELVVSQKEDVIRIPTKSLHASGDKNYVYVFDEDGVRRMKYVTAGIIGEDYVEITEGLSEGEVVTVG